MIAKARHFSALDHFIAVVDRSVRVLAGVYAPPARPNPATQSTESPLSSSERRHSAGLMRVNHVGEICAQALYLGQSLTARSEVTRTAMQQAATEENDHLVWCQERLRELNSHTSDLNPLWYSYALTLGMVAGLLGDAWSLGFIVETERQVVTHLESHLQRLALHDQKSRAIVAQMAEDEAQHATTAIQSGARALPTPVKQAMRGMAKVMTTTAYWV